MTILNRHTNQYKAVKVDDMNYNRICPAQLCAKRWNDPTDDRPGQWVSIAYCHKCQVTADGNKKRLQKDQVRIGLGATL